MADSSFFWFRRGSPTEGRRWALEALRVGKTVGPPLVGWVVALAGFCGFLTGDTELGHQEMKEGLELLGDDREARGVALAGLAVIHRGRGEHQAARESLEEAFPLLREFGLASTFYDQLGAMARSEGDLERSRELHEQGLEVAPEYRPCREWVESLRRRPSPWFLTWGVVYEFLRVVTHRRVLPRPASGTEAWGFMEAVLASPSLRLLIPTDRHRQVLAEVLFEVPAVQGNLFHDAAAATLMREHGVRSILTRDTDFHRFPFVEVTDPLR